MPDLPHPTSNFYSRGATYKICWTTEASQEVLEISQQSVKDGETNTINHEIIIRLLRRTKRDAAPVGNGDPDLGLFVIMYRNVAYTILISYFPAITNNGTCVCEISQVAVTTDERMKRLAA